MLNNKPFVMNVDDGMYAYIVFMSIVSTVSCSYIQIISGSVSIGLMVYMWFTPLASLAIAWDWYRTWDQIVFGVKK